MFNVVTKEFQFGRDKVVLETGRVARQANSVLITMGGVTVLVAVVAAKEAKAGQDFFPLTVNYQEKTYAAGRIPGGYFKREGRATEKETLIEEDDWGKEKKVRERRFKENLDAYENNSKYASL